jgi:hypothetical protein
LPLDLNTSKELFSDAYMRAVVSAAGMSLDRTSVDRDGLDGFIEYVGPIGEMYSPMIGFQLKCTASPSCLKNGHVSHALKAANYNQLCVTNSGVPRILIVVLVPAEIDNWLLHAEEMLKLHRCGYWLNLQGEAETLNGHTKTVHLPRDQQFTVASLQEMMQRVGAGGEP